MALLLDALDRPVVYHTDLYRGGIAMNTWLDERLL